MKKLPIAIWSERFRNRGLILPLIMCVFFTIPLGISHAAATFTPFTITDFSTMCKPDNGWFSLSDDGKLACSTEGRIHLADIETGKAEPTHTIGTRPFWHAAARSLLYLREGFLMVRHLRPGRDPGIPNRIWSNSRIVDFVMSPRTSAIVVSCLEEGLVFNRLMADARNFKEAMTPSGIRGHNLSMASSGDRIYFIDSDAGRSSWISEKLFTANITMQGGARQISLPGNGSEKIHACSPSPGRRHLALIIGQTPEVAFLDFEDNVLLRGLEAFKLLGIDPPPGRPLHVCWEPGPPVLWISTTNGLWRVAYLGRQGLDSLPLEKLARQEISILIDRVKTDPGPESPQISYANSPPSVRAGWKAFNAGHSRAPGKANFVIFGSLPLPGKPLSKFFSAAWRNLAEVRKRIMSEIHRGNWQTEDFGNTGRAHRVSTSEVQK